MSQKISIFVLLFCNFMAVAQIKKSTVDINKSPYSVFKQAKKYSDGTTAIHALHQIIVLEGQNSVYRDSLALTYFKMNNPVSCHLIAKEILEKKPNDLLLLEINALSLQQLNATKEAITAFEKLFNLSKNKYHGYQLASLQFSIKRIEEAKETVNQASLCLDLKDFTLDFEVSKETSQKVPLNAALLNLKGLIAFQINDLTTAKSAFEDALKIMPDFQLAIQNNETIKIELAKNN